MSITYDQKADVLYGNFGDGEPTFAEELEDDFVILEIGWFTGLPKGFRIIGLIQELRNIYGIGVKMCKIDGQCLYKRIMGKEAPVICDGNINYYLNKGSCNETEKR